MKKISHTYVKLLIVLMCSTTSCVSGCASLSVFPASDVEIFPRRAFVQIRQSIELRACEENKEAKNSNCRSAVMKYVSSGAYIFHSEVESGVSYALTAGHSCKSSVPKRQKVGEVMVERKDSIFTVVDLSGVHHKAEVVSTNSRFDLCLVRVRDVTDHPPVLRVAKNELKIGEEAHNMAAPHGLYWQGAVLLFRGLFSGYHDRGFSIYTIPTKPGSSGSPIINKKNELVGVIFAGYPVIENVGLSSPLAAIKIFLSNSVAAGEMELFLKRAKLNKGNITTTTIIKEMAVKLDKVFNN